MNRIENQITGVIKRGEEEIEVTGTVHEGGAFYSSREILNSLLAKKGEEIKKRNEK